MQSDSKYKDQVMQFYRNVLATGDSQQLEALVAPDYVPHCAPLSDVPVLQPGLDALHRRIQCSGPVPHRVYRMVADADLVFVQVSYDGQVRISGIDIFRFNAAGLIAEHWNCRQRIDHDAPGDNSRFAGGGVSTPVSAERRASMKSILTKVLLQIWGQGEAALVPVHYDESYVQHNLDMPGGFQRIKEIVETEIQRYIIATGGPFPVDIHRMGAEGDLIFVHYSIFMAGINRKEGQRATNADIFRIGSDDRMIEHWDVLQIEGEPLPDERTLF